MQAGPSLAEKSGLGLSMTWQKGIMTLADDKRPEATLLIGLS